MRGAAARAWARVWALVSGVAASGASSPEMAGAPGAGRPPAGPAAASRPAAPGPKASARKNSSSRQSPERTGRSPDKDSTNPSSSMIRPCKIASKSRQIQAQSLSRFRAAPTRRPSGAAIQAARRRWGASSKGRQVRFNSKCSITGGRSKRQHRLRRWRRRTISCASRRRRASIEPEKREPYRVNKLAKSI